MLKIISGEVHTLKDSEYIPLTLQTTQVMYLDYVNNFLTVNRFAEYYNLEVPQAYTLIKKGEEIQTLFSDLNKEMVFIENLKTGLQL